MSVGAGVAQDLAGNPNTASNTINTIYDGTPPGVTLASGVGAYTNAAFSVTATFTEPVTGFVAGDVTVTNGTVQNFTGSDDSYSFDVSPSADGPVSVSVGAGVAQDPAGNPNTASNSINTTYDGTPPDVTLASGVGAYTNAAFSVTATFTEPVTGFVAGDVTVANGTVQNFTGSDDSYSFDVSPLADGPVSVSVGAGVAQDLAGNPNTASNSINTTYDGTPPTATITVYGNCPTASDYIVFHIDFSEAVLNFTASHIAPAPGALDGSIVFEPVTEQQYFVTLHLDDPQSDGEAGIVASGAGVTDYAGNPYTGGASPLCAVRNWPGFSVSPEDAYLYIGDSHTLRVEVAETGVPMQFQWKWDDGAKAVQDGPASPEWPLNTVTQSQAGIYWCEVTYDGNLYASDPASVFVEPHVFITQHPEGGEKEPGASHPFLVEAAGGYPPLEYIWLKNDVEIATGTELLLEDLTAEDTGAYRVLVMDAYGDAAFSETAMLVVLSGPGLPAGGMLALAGLAVAFGLAGAHALRSRKSRE